MPEPVKTEKKDPEVKVIPSDVTPEPEKITIDAGTGQPVVPSTPATASVSPEEFKKTLNAFGYEMRQQRKDFQEALQRLAPQYRPAPVAEPQKKEEDFDPALDAVAKENWQKGVGLVVDKRAEAIAEKKFKAMMEERDKLQQINYRQQQTTNQLARETAWTLEKTPSLQDETSEEFKGYYATYSKMLSEDPTLKDNPRGPRLVWYEWKAANPEKTAAVNAEAERLKRVAAGQGAPSRQTLGAKTYQLTQEEIDFCKNNKLSPARYAVTKEANLKEGVTAQ